MKHDATDLWTQSKNQQSDLPGLNASTNNKHAYIVNLRSVWKWRGRAWFKQGITDIKISPYFEYKLLSRALALPGYLAAELMGNSLCRRQECYFLRVMMNTGWHWLVPAFPRKLERICIHLFVKDSGYTPAATIVIKISIIWINFIIINTSWANTSREARCLPAFF